MRKLSVALLIVFLIFSVAPFIALAESREIEPLPPLNKETLNNAIKTGVEEDPITNSWKIASLGSAYAWSVPDQGFKLFGVFQYQDSKDYIGTTRYNQRDNPYNSAYPYNEAIFS